MFRVPEQDRHAGGSIFKKEKEEKKLYKEIELYKEINRTIPKK